MDVRFQHLGYHLDLYCPKTMKYMGSIETEDDPERDCGYFGRRKEKIDCIGRKGLKEVKFNDEYITELVPLCGRLVGDRFNTLRDVHMRTVTMRK